MNVKQIYELKIEKLDKGKLSLHPNNHSRRQYIRSIITDELLGYLYTNEMMSANKIVEYIKGCGINVGGAGYVIARLKSKNIKTRDIKETCHIESVKNQKQQTLKDRYNVSNISQIQEVKDKKAQQCIEKYGVDNNFKSDIIKLKIKEFWRREYGVDHPSELGINQRFYVSRPHKNVLNILDELNIKYEFETNKHFKAFNYTLQKRFCPRVDIFIPAKNLVIEVFGTFWHADPKKYKPTDTFDTVYGKHTAAQIWLKDKIKLEHLANLGYNVEVIWDNNITKDSVEKIISKYENQKS